MVWSRSPYSSDNGVAATTRESKRRLRYLVLMPKIVTRLALVLLASALLLANPVHAQGPTPPGQNAEGQAPSSEPSQALPESTTNALRTLAAQLKAKRADRKKANDANDQASVTRLDEEIQQLRWQFAGVMTQIDVQKFEVPEDTKLDLLADALEALRPVVDLLNGLTEDVRRRLAVDKEIETVERRIAVTKAARVKIQNTLQALRQLPITPRNTDAIQQVNIELRDQWIPREARFNNELLVLAENRDQLKAAQKDWFDTLQENANELLGSGLSILMCVAVFLIVFFVLRLVSTLIIGKKRKAEFRGRLADVILRIITLVLAVAATLIVPYARGEHVMLVIGVLVVIGVGWVIVKSAPAYAEQIRLMLNIGSVREGERILIDGLPFRIDALRFYSRLSNPALTGGQLRVPIGQLIGNRSRAAGPDEPWFPCKQGDVVAIGDDLVGRVRLQTPEVVVLVERHDAPRSYPTAAFLELNPRNLSQGFEITVTFAIDYCHQKDAADKVPAMLQADLEAGLAQSADAESVHKARVELAAAGSSSLDFQVEVQFAGKAAIHYHILDRLVNRLLVQSCSKHGFGIPFPQLQVHGVGPR